MGEPLTCPCGDDHAASRSWGLVASLIKEKGEHVPVHVEGVGGWLVPRVYIAFHGLFAREIPALAKRYGWAQVPAVP
jgi:hypothetical protein